MLDKKIAQKIADEVINSLGYNINVMNENAIIIGSGSPERIGTYHEVAMQVINNGNTCEVTETESKKLQGVKSGINMPILNKVGKVIGVVGITGDPDEVRNIGKLVKMTAELIVEQQESMNRFYTHRNDKEIFLNTLISDQMTISADEVAEWGERIGYDMACFRVAIILSFGSNQEPYEKERLEKVLDQIKSSACHLKQDVSSVMSNGHILIFKAVKSVKPWDIEASINSYLIDAIHLEDSEDVCCFVGGYYRGIKGYGKSYGDAYDIYQSGFYKKGFSVYFAHHHYFWKLFNQLDKEIYRYVIEPYIEKIQTCFGKGTEDAMLTMRKVLDYNFQFEKVAGDLFIHKNTVIFRKKKMEACLGFSLKCNGNDNVLFEIILNYYEKLKKTIIIS